MADPVAAIFRTGPGRPSDQSISIYNAGGGNLNLFGLIDAVANDTATSALPSPLNPVLYDTVGVSDEFDGNLASSALIDHTQTPLHANDTQPVRIYSLEGSITDGTLGSDGNYNSILQISVDKPAQIEAGQNVLNLAFLGQNLGDAQHHRRPGYPGQQEF